MNLKTLVLVSGINNLSDARYCAGMGVDFLGFNCNPGDPRYLNSDTFKEIAGWISGVAFVGEFGEADPKIIESTVESLGFDYAEVSEPKLLPYIKSLGIPAILRIDIGTPNNLDDLENLLNAHVSSVDFFILESSVITTEDDLAFAKEKANEFPIMLGFGITAENVVNLINTTSIKGISLRGGNEIKPGYKDFDELAEILESIEGHD